MNIWAVPIPQLVRKKINYWFSSFLLLFIDGFCFTFLSAELEAAKLEWGNSDHLGEILQKHNDGFDLILGADIYILMFDTDFFIYLDLSFIYTV